MGKYEPLASHLTDMPRDRWTATFDEIERVLKFKLPPSARRYDAWWSNSRRGNHSQAKAWIDAGWYIVSIDRKKEKVVLARSAAAGATEVTSAVHDLWRKAREISGIDDREALERRVVESFIRREAGKRLIALGGSMTDAEAPPRRRFD